MQLLNQGFRATNVICAAIKCGRKFQLEGDLYDRYYEFGKKRGSLNDLRIIKGEKQQSWMSSMRNALQRMTGNSAEFQNRGGTLDVFENVGRGKYVFRDEWYQTLLDGANRHHDSLVQDGFSGLQIAVDGDAAELVTTHLIGCHAQQMAKEWCEGQGWRVQDMSLHKAYDLSCVLPGRTGGHCYVECKGTTKTFEAAGFGLTENEFRVAIKNLGNYKMAMVTDIRVKGGKPHGGQLYVVDPFDFDEQVKFLRFGVGLHPKLQAHGEQRW